MENILLENLPKPGKSPLKLKAFEVSRFDIKKTTIEGIENIPLTPCVIATTHLSDNDIPEVVLALADKRKVGIVSQETNLTAPLLAPFIRAVGKENFFTITNTYRKGNSTYSLRLDDFEKMKKGITEGGRTMIIAAHNPTRNWQLPESPGLGAVILAHLANVPLVPAAVDIESPTPVAQSTDIKTRVKNFVTLRRPNARIIFCEPLRLANMPSQELKAAIDLYSPDQRRNMSTEQIAAGKRALAILKREATQIMSTLASKLPPEKRGSYGRIST